jgi:hypothetical protein
MFFFKIKVEKSDWRKDLQCLLRSCLVVSVEIAPFVGRVRYHRRPCGEGRHSVARIIFHGKRGELRQRYREGQEDQLGALGLVTNIVVLWNTIYMDAALSQLRREGYPVRDEDAARLSPLVHDHINVLGRYSFAVPDAVTRGELRPLRDPTDSGA